MILLLQLSIYNSFSQPIFKILNIYLINEIENLNELILKNIFQYINNILEFLKEISLEHTEEKYNEIIDFTHYFGDFLFKFKLVLIILKKFKYI